MTCDEVFTLLSDYLDGELDDKQRAAVEAHVEGCQRCAQFGREFEAIVSAIRSADRPALPDALAAQIERLAK